MKVSSLLCCVLRRGTFFGDKVWVYADVWVSGSNEANYRTAAYQAIAAYLGQATADVIPAVLNTIDTVLTRMEHLLVIHVRRFTCLIGDLTADMRNG